MNSIKIVLEIISLLFRMKDETIKAFHHFRKAEIFRAAADITLGSLPIVTLSTAFAGLVVTQEISRHMDHALHTVSMIPGFTGQFVLRELGIAIPALLVVSKIGASITAEIGMMTITDQIDALKLLKIDPVSYLVFPRWLACIFAMTVLTLVSISVTLTCSILAAISKHHMGFYEYLNTLRHFIHFSDLICALTKGVVFGSVIPIVSCVYGFRCKKGAQGVGIATTNSVVASTIAVISLDFWITYLFKAIQ